MTTLNTEIPAEKREGELTPDELEVVCGGWLAWSAWANPTTEVIGGRNKSTDAHANMHAQ
jgi:hypothetical protein